MPREPFKLSQQKQHAQGDQDDGAHRLPALPTRRMHRRNGRDRRNRWDTRPHRSRRRRRVRPLIGGLKRSLKCPLEWSLEGSLIGRLIRALTGGLARARRSRWRALRRPTARDKPTAQLVQSERVGQRIAVAPCPRRVIRVEHLVEDPPHHEDAEDAKDVRRAHQHREDRQVHQALDELAVVHRAHAGNHAQHGRQPGTRPSGGRRHIRPLRALPRHPARLAENLSARSFAHARLAQCLAAALAVRRRVCTAMVYAIHGVLLSNLCTM